MQCLSDYIVYPLAVARTPSSGWIACTNVRKKCVASSASASASVRSAYVNDAFGVATLSP